MGRQEAELLGPELRRVYEYQIADYNRLVDKAGLPGRLLNSTLFPLYSSLGQLGDDSSFRDEIAGMASGLGVPPATSCAR